MFLPPPKPRAPLARTAASVAVHVAVIWALLHQRQLPIRVTLPGTASGSHIDLTYLPGQAALPKSGPKSPRKPVDPAVAPPRPKPSIPPPATNALVAPGPVAPTVASPDQASLDIPSPASGSTTGTDARGEGDIRIALTTYSPDPEPDLSQLPHGSQGDVIVDVTIDQSGRVADLQILRALGFGIEDNVARTVRTWVFHPATRDGTPIASVQELHFHFARS